MPRARKSKISDKVVIVEKKKKGKEEIKDIQKEMAMIPYDPRKKQAEMAKFKPNSMSNKNPVADSYPTKIATAVKPYYFSNPLNKSGAVRVRGMDMIAIVSTDTNVLGGTGLLLNGVRQRIPLSPLSKFFDSTKFGYDGLKFEKIQFQNIRLVYLPEIGTSQDGSVILAYDPDIGDDFIEDITTANNQLNTMQTLMGYQDSETGSAWAPLVLNVLTVRDDPKFVLFTNYVGGDERLAFRGQFYVCSGGSLPTNKVIGKILIEYEVDLYDPSVDQLNASVKRFYNSAQSYTTGGDMIALLADASATVQSASGGSEVYPIVDATNLAGKTKAVSIPPGKHKVYLNNKSASGGTPVFTATNASLVSNIPDQTSTLTVANNTNSSAASTATSTWEAILDVGLGGAKFFLDQLYTGTSLTPLIQFVEWAASAIL